jgi:tetratricopeptide (TPR) repeat protein
MNQQTDDRDAAAGHAPADSKLSSWRDSCESTRPEFELDSVVMGRRAVSPEELLERLCNDQVRRWRDGQRVPAEAYLSMHPTIRDEGEAAFELIYGEFLLREELGERPSLAEFGWRFPRFAERLQRQLDLHDVLRIDGPIVPPSEEASEEDGMTEGDGAHRGGHFIAPGYRILGELGRGGMGAVYKAWQIRLKRIVALKVIRPDAYADSEAAARFQAEAEAAARFQHPNLVPVFEIGEHEGMGYLVLEYAAGGGLDRRLAGTPQDPGDSARLIEILARAIHYAHQRGIVHRDLKPANVLLTEEGVPKITDFGLAKLLERDDVLTRAGEILGTPTYMAPEQVRGLTDQITPATDVYSLGAILYEMLTGRPPFKGTTPLSTLEQVSSQEPLSPGKLQRNLPRDLETICLKCLEKDPDRRYPTALALAEDLHRFLQGQPILARPSSPWERAWKWARRRPGIATAIAALLVLLVVLLVGGVYYNAQLREKMLAAREAEQLAATNAERAFEQRNLALQALNQLVYDVQEKLAQTPATRSLRQEVLKTAIRGLEELGRSTAGAPPDLSQAVAYQKLGDIFRIIGRSMTARQHYNQSQRLAEDRLTQSPGEIEAAEVLYRTHMGLGLLNLRAKHLDATKAEFRRAVIMAESIVASKPGQDIPRRDLIEAYFELGRAYSFAHEDPTAEVWFRKMHDLAESWVSEDPSQTRASDLLASSLRKLADLKKFSQDYVEARQLYTRAIEIGEGLLIDAPENFGFRTNLGKALDDLAGVAKKERGFEEARQLFLKAESHFGELVRTDPENLDSRLLLLHTQYNRAVLDRDQSRFAAAESGFRGVRDRLSVLEREGRLEDMQDLFVDIKSLDKEIASCESASGIPRNRRPNSAPVEPVRAPE